MHRRRLSVKSVPAGVSCLHNYYNLHMHGIRYIVCLCYMHHPIKKVCISNNFFMYINCRCRCWCSSVSPNSETPSSTQFSRARYCCFIILFFTLKLSRDFHLSRYLIENNMINFNQGLGVFTVVGTTETPHAIRLFPKESFTCMPIHN